MPVSDKIRPTQDRVREALFSILMGVIDGARFLDLFAGSGAVGLEAVSRGAAEAFFVEADRKCFQTLKRNLETFALNPRDFTAQADALKWVKTCGNNRKFDIVFADPPYLLAREQGFVALAEALSARDCLAPGGFFVAETDEDTPAQPLDGFEMIRDRCYGNTRLAVYRRLKTGEENKA